MTRPILAVAVLLRSSWAAAAAAPASPVPSFEAGVAAGLAAIKAAAPQWSSVGMTISNGPNFVMITDPSLRVSLNGSGSMGNAWFSGTAGNENLSFSATAFGRGWNLFGSGVNVTMSRFGSGWSVWGSVGKTDVSYTIDRFGSGLGVWGQSGANLSVSGWVYNLQASGQIDEARFSPQALAVLGATLALAAPAAQK